MKTVAMLMFTTVTLAASGIALLAGSAYAYRFEDVCPAQAPPGSDQSQWTQFRDACIRDDSARDRPFFDQCLTKCAVAAAAEGFRPPTPTPPKRVTNQSPIVTPNWCGDVPASPPPPHFGNDPGDWERARQACMRAPAFDIDCMDTCRGAEELWQRWKAGQLSETPSWPAPTNKLQGPFPLQGGAKGYIMPVPATPNPSPSPSSGGQSSGDPPGPFYSYAGEDLNAEIGEPPDVAADVSPTQNVEFINEIGMSVWAKPSPGAAPTPTSLIDPVSFWCGSNGVNGQPLLGCFQGAETWSKLFDPQVGYDSSLGRWVITQLATDSTQTIGFIYLAVSSTNNVDGNWEKWSDDACITNSTFNVSDQPLLGWSNNAVAVDIVCANVNPVNNAIMWPDEVHVIPNSTITSASFPLPLAMPAPCDKMAPARDEGGISSSIYLLASIVPTNGNPFNQPGCAPSNSNQDPYVVEYLANGSGVFGTDASGNSCSAGSSGCQPFSISPQFGSPGLFILASHAQQQIAPNETTYCQNNNCEIDLKDARIFAAQIRPVNFGGSQSPVLTTAFATGISNSDSGQPKSQNLWFIQDLGAGRWLVSISFSQANQWMAYPTIALDTNQNFYLGSTNFHASSFPQTFWSAWAGVSSPVLLAQNVLESSSTTYLGRGGSMAERWGDYNTMVFDPDFIGPNGLPSMWEVEEATCPNGLQNCAGRDESTTWEALEGIIPPVIATGWGYFTETEGFVQGSYPVFVEYPPNLQNGDTLVAFVTTVGDGTVAAMHQASDLTNRGAWTLVGGPNGFTGFTSISNPANSDLNTTNHWVLTRQISAANPIPPNGYDTFTEINGAPNEEIQSSTFAYRYAGLGLSAAVTFNNLNTTMFQAPAITSSTNGSRILQRVFVSPSYDLSPTASAESYEDQYGNFVLFNYPSVLTLFVEPFGTNRTPELVTDVAAPAAGTNGPWNFTSYSQAPAGAPTPAPPPDNPGGAWTVLLPGQQ